ncbi:MAG: TonB-dependent receptor [Pseudomonadota bacterium]
MPSTRWAVCATAALATPSLALAQTSEAEDASETVENITVTGQKRDESLLESDLSVTVLNEQAIREARLRDVRRLDDLVPNVQFNESGQLSSVFVSIRGIESNPFIVNRAAIYIDGIPFRELSNAVLNQIESIEVLRGPQSTLYGANSEAGLILINTRRPTESVTSEFRVTSSTYNGGDASNGVDGFIAGSLSGESLLGSLAFKASHEDAYISNPASSINEPGEITELFLQGRLFYEPSDNLSIRATAYVLDIDAPGLFEQEYSPVDRGLYNATYADTFNGGRNVGAFEFLNDVPKQTDEREFVGGVVAEYQLAPGSVRASISYTDFDKDSAGLDLDLTAFQTVAGRDLEDETVWSAEISFTSNDSDVFEYLVGASWYHEEREQALGTAFGPAALDSYLFSPAQLADAEDVSIFGSATFGLPVDGLSATVGVRYDRAERGTSQSAGVLDLGFTQLLFQDIELDETFDEVLPRFVLSYEASDSLNWYASASKGYIPGGFNLTAAQADVADEVVRFDQESVWSYETGVKYQLPEGRGYVNVAAFFIESDNWQEVQVLVNDQGQVISSAFIAAAASIESSGFEIEAVYYPTDRLKLNVGIGLADAEYTDFQASATENLRGNPVKLVPDVDANLSVRYEFDNGFFARGEFSYIGDTPLDERSNAVRDGVGQWNAQVGYEAERYSIRLFGENLTDERLESGLAFENFGFGSDGNFYAPLDAPRVIGVELEARF